MKESPLIQYMMPDGTLMLAPEDQLRISKMLVPVKCNRCGRAYDLCDGKVIHRYADCTFYKTPCCGQNVDDREWVTAPAFTRLERPHFPNSKQINQTITKKQNKHENR